MFKKKSIQRRKHFLIDSNQKKRSRPKKTRNRALNFLAQFLLLRYFFRFLRTSFLVTLLIISMSGFVAFALLSPYFHIKKITVNREATGVDIEAVQATLKPFYGKNLIFLDTQHLKKTLLQNFLDFRTVEVKEQWPDQIVITVKLSPPAFTLFDMETANFSTISADGVILSNKSDDQLPTIKVKGLSKPLLPGTKFIEATALEKIKKIEAELLAQVDTGTQEIILLPDAQEVHFITLRNTALWFDLRTNIDEQIQKLKLGAKEIGLHSKPIEHVDLRIPNQLFWK